LAATSTRGMAPFLASATTVAQNSGPRFDNRDIAREHHAARRPMERYRGPDGYVGMDYFGQAKLAEDPLESALHRASKCSFQSPTAQQVAAERIGNRQRMAALPSAWKMPFEVGTPNPVRGITRCQAVRVGFASTHSPALSRHQAPFAKYLADRARHRQRNPRMVPFENHEQLTWPPSGVLLTRSHHELHDVRAHSTGVRVWCSGLVRQRFRPQPRSALSVCSLAFG